MAAFALLAVAGCVTLAPPSPLTIAVDARPTEVEYRSFPRGHPPPQVIDPFNLDEGFCMAIFDCRVGLHYLVPLIGISTVTVTIDQVEITASQRIAIWLADGYPPNVPPHEETHRAISERYYEHAYEIARRLAVQAVGRKITVPNRNKAAAAEEALAALQEEIRTAYLRETRDRATFANERFDEITDHGREPIANSEAMQRAIADENAHWAAAKHD